MLSHYLELLVDTTPTGATRKIEGSTDPILKQAKKLREDT